MFSFCLFVCVVVQRRCYRTNRKTLFATISHFIICETPMPTVFEFYFSQLLQKFFESCLVGWLLVLTRWRRGLLVVSLQSNKDTFFNATLFNSLISILSMFTLFYLKLNKCLSYLLTSTKQHCQFIRSVIWNLVIHIKWISHGL